MYGLSLVTAPTIEPLEPADVRRQVRLSQGNEYHDPEFLRLITAARLWVERYTNRALINQTWDYKFSYWPCGLEPILIPKAPLSSVTSVKAYDTSNVEQTIATTVYKVLTSREPGEIRLKNAQSWPSLYGEPDVITVRFVAGYGSTAASVPMPLKQAMLLLISHWFENTSAVLVGSISKELEFSLQALLESYLIGDEFHVYAR